MSDLHGRLVKLLDDFHASAFEDGYPVLDVIDALADVVDRHKPEPCRDGKCWEQTGHQLCAACGSGMSHPCDELKLIAEKLGITEGEQITNGQV